MHLREKKNKQVVLFYQDFNLIDKQKFIFKKPKHLYSYAGINEFLDKVP